MSLYVGSIFFVTSVSIIPGATQFAVIPRRPYSVAIDFVADAKAHLDAAYADIPASPMYPAMDVIDIIRPYLLRTMCGTAARDRLYGTVKFTCIILLRYWLSDFSNIHPSTMPALFTNMSNFPHVSITCFINVYSASIAVKSSGMQIGFGAFWLVATNLS